jgi:two-component system, response regulator PdtaR
MKHALVLEDRAVIAAMIVDELAECGYTTFDVASSQEEAIRLAERRCPDLITADERLEHGSGIAAVRQICAHRQIPVIFITADGASIRRSVPDAVVLEKPFTRLGMVQAIEQAVLARRGGR